MRSLLSILAAVLLISACKKAATEDKTTPFVSAKNEIIVLSEGNLSGYYEPKVTLELSDSTFYDNTGFNYFFSPNHNSYSHNTIDDSYTCFVPFDKAIKNKAYMNYDFKDSENVAGAKAYRVKYTESASANTVVLNDTSQWNLVSGLQYNGTLKTFRFPVDNFSYVYFLARKQ